MLCARRRQWGKTLFEVVDLCVTALWDLPDTARIGNDLDYHVVLDQLGTPLAHSQLFRKGTDGNWRLLVPGKQELERLLARLREARGITTPDPDAHFELRTPRDTIRTFIEQVKPWDEGGRDHVLGTLDLSALDPAVRDTEAPLLAEYLQQVLDRAGFLIWQELPNDPESRRPYVHFQHPLGGIGGFAFAIAAQDTLSNFFGSAVLLADRPFRRGDLITVGEHRGFVEHLGRRSTRIRTFDDSVVIIPNRELAREAIDNRSQRRTRTVEFTLGATYDTTPKQLDRFYNTLRAHYQTAEDVSEEEMFVGIEALSASSIDSGSRRHRLMRRS